MSEFWHWLWKVGDMPATFGGQLTLLISLLTLVTLTIGVRKAVRAHTIEEKRKHELDAQHREWFELLLIDFARRTGYRIPKELIEKHMRINGNSKLSSDEKDRIYGEDRPRSGDSDELDSKGNPIRSRHR